MLIVVAITVQHFQKLCKFQVICETVSVSPSHPEQPSIKRQLKGAPKAKGRSSAILAKFSAAIGRRNNLDKIAQAKKGCPQCIRPNSPVVHADSEWNTHKCHFLSYIQNMWHCLRTNDVYYNNCQGQVLGCTAAFGRYFFKCQQQQFLKGGLLLKLDYDHLNHSGSTIYWLVGWYRKAWIGRREYFFQCRLFPMPSGW